MQSARPLLCLERKRPPDYDLFMDSANERRGMSVHTPPVFHRHGTHFKELKGKRLIKALVKSAQGLFKRSRSSKLGSLSPASPPADPSSRSPQLKLSSSDPLLSRDLSSRLWMWSIPHIFQNPNRVCCNSSVESSATARQAFPAHRLRQPSR